MTAKNKMVMSTTSVLDGMTVKEDLGIVTGETILGANIFRDIFAGVRDIIGGRAKSYEKVLTEAKQSALGEMADKAKEMGANGIIGIDLDYETVGGMLMVSASGTAVIIK